jgi:hypothetical protein
MKTALLALALVVLVPFAVIADSSLVRFKGGIGVDPVSGIALGAPVSNVVCGVVPGGIPWRIGRLRANVQIDGHITVEGRGLLLAGGNIIATNGGQSVRAELFCTTTPPPCGTPSFTSTPRLVHETGASDRQQGERTLVRRRHSGRGVIGSSAP